MIIGYLDNNFRNIGANEQRDIINGYAQSTATSVDVFLCEPDLYNFLSEPLEMNSIKGVSQCL